MDIGCTEAVEKKAKLEGKNPDTRAKWGKIKNINMKFQQAKISASAKGIHVVSTAQGVDVTDDNNFDWKIFAEQHIKKQIYKNKAKIDVYDQLKFRWNDFITYVWEYR